MSNNSIIYPGTFDPITYGHIDIIVRALRLFNKVIVAIAASSTKPTIFTTDERVALATKVLAQYPNVVVREFTGLLTDFAVREQCFVILRGIRNFMDFEYEAQLVNAYNSLEPRIDTVFLPAQTKHLSISSSMVREIASLHGNVAEFVPIEVQKALRDKY